MSITASAITDLSVLAGPSTPERGDPAGIGRELSGFISLAITARPRSQQKIIGPSEVGTPCQRRLAHKLAGTPEVNARGPAWRPTVGEGVHEWLTSRFDELNELWPHPRFLTEQPVNVGRVGTATDGWDLTGTSDLYDLWWHAIVDWKIVGPTTLRAVRAHGPEPTYRTQVQCYGRGMARRGLPVRTVAIMFLPSNGELADAVFWHEPYDERVALDALARVAATWALTQRFGSQVAAGMPTADAHCQYCGWWKPSATDLTTACPGHEGRPVRTDRLFDLIAPTQGARP